MFSELVTNAIQFIYMKKKVRFAINSKALVKGLVSTATMAVCVCAVMQFNLPNTLGLVIKVGCGILVYGVVNLLMKNELMYEIMEKIKGKIVH